MTPSSPGITPRGWRLQCGHAAAGVDDEYQSCRAKEQLALQCGHAAAGVDDEYQSGRARGQLAFQWGHAAAGVDDVMGRSGKGIYLRGFNVATPLPAWMTSTRSTAPGSGSCFNVATPPPAWM